MEASSVPTRRPVGDGQADPTAGSAERYDVNFVPTSIADPGPLGLAAFALTTFVLSMFNSGLVSDKGEPVVFPLALTYGGIAQFVAGLFEFRTGNTCGAVAVCSYGAFWLSFWAIQQSCAAKIPASSVGHAFGLYLIASAIFTAYMSVA